MSIDKEISKTSYEVPQPDWGMLVDLLEQAENWLRSEEGELIGGNIILAREVITTTREVMDSILSDPADPDECIRLWVRRVEWSAFWLAASTGDEQLRERVERLCERGGEIVQGMREAAADWRRSNMN